MAKASGTEDGPVIIKKYANRRLYNTSSSSYITLDDLSKMTREGVDFQVLDAKTGADITHSILTQIIMEEEANGEQMLPVSFLRQLIGMYGNSMQSIMPHYLEATMQNFLANQKKLQETFKNGVSTNPFTRIAETNMAMLKAATAAFMPGEVKSDGKEESGEPETSSESKDELASLREQMEEMKRKLDSLGK
ncbi:polyhydroxyalkanoate synthesis repressor PhaR [Croceicoccus estronivorus]|uniref:polyhydroxyalkanoate synthesis repressor PhaR n=1 Tax=Croceicoccus estronivorus TaxID=1172626 RepID=UPI0008378F5C|nr:polyhydroxyalkanoate synthesis repressor PhaR [Croceicoccus estronivorus]OCC24539.1 polyhydroxyalkanoate synthesis repressor PhaR [Croceicoccus estronivorus]